MWKIERALHEAYEIKRDKSIELAEEATDFGSRLGMRMLNIDSQIACLESLSTLASFKPENWRAVHLSEEYKSAASGQPLKSTKSQRDPFDTEHVVVSRQERSRAGCSTSQKKKQ